MSAREVKEFDEELGKFLGQFFPEAILKVPHRVFAVIAHKPRALPIKQMQTDPAKAGPLI